jgi:hypothetical protein
MLAAVLAARALVGEFLERALLSAFEVGLAKWLPRGRSSR